MIYPRAAGGGHPLSPFPTYDAQTFPSYWPDGANRPFYMASLDPLRLRCVTPGGGLSVKAACPVLVRRGGVSWLLTNQDFQSRRRHDRSGKGKGWDNVTRGFTAVLAPVERPYRWAPGAYIVYGLGPSPKAARVVLDSRAARRLWGRVCYR